jgi:FtsP/CotA-like multicopper oxidase with cupredoxin domain
MLEGQQFTRIGGDQGLIEAPQSSDRILLTPGQRADVVLELALPRATTRAVRWVPYQRGFGSTEFRNEETVFTVQTSDEPAQASPPLPVLHRAIEALDLSRASQQFIDLTQSSMSEPFALGINGVPADRALPLMATVGDVQMWTVHNTVAFAHPFHLHGFFFQIIDMNGVPPTVREWRDTVDVPIDATVHLAISFDERPGMWMFHCHILDHADAGMMGMVNLHGR